MAKAAIRMFQRKTFAKKTKNMLQGFPSRSQTDKQEGRQYNSNLTKALSDATIIRYMSVEQNMERSRGSRMRLPKVKIPKTIQDYSFDTTNE